jgi:hypothetical protein
MVLQQNTLSNAIKFFKHFCNLNVLEDENNARANIPCFYIIFSFALD